MPNTDLLSKIESHIQTVEQKKKRVEETKTRIPTVEFQRDIAIGIELWQQYIDVLDEITEKIEVGEMV